tara:strand:+ start:1050 stop:1214 length:165 start_codon:yes stop_codon:yes gene_type:complete
VSKLENAPSKFDLIIIMKTLALIGADLIVEPRKNTTADSGLVMGGLIVPKNAYV